jgi:signal transduction histidine kinase
MKVADPAIPRAQRWPIRWRLPLLICTLLLACVFAFGWAAHREVQKALLEVAHARLQSVSRQLVTLLGQSTQQRLDESKRLVSRPSMKALIDAPEDAAAREEVQTELAAFLKTSSQTVGLEIWSPAGVRLLEMAQTQTAAATRSGIPPMRTAAPSGPGFGPLQPFRDGVFYELVTPIAGTNGTGLFVLRRMTTMPPAPASAGPAPAPTPGPGPTPGGLGVMISGLIGSGMKFGFGAKDGVWTDLTRIVPPPPDTAVAATTVTDVAEYQTANGDLTLGIMAPLHDTPWLLWVNIPRSAALAPAGVFLRRGLPLSLIIVAFGSTIAWIAARRVIRPLDELTAAADSIAAGDLKRRAEIRADEEFGRLGVVFNAMAANVEDGYHILEDRVRERTADLEQALESLRNTQEELVRREKLAMLGQLASGVGHELRNPLGVMTNAVYFLEMVQPNAEPIVKEYHALLRAQIGLSEKIVSDLLDYARIKPPRRESVPLTRLIDDQLARVSVSDDIRIVRELPAGLPPVHVDPVQIGQVVLNLLVNAVQAMEEKGGVLTLRGSIDDGRVRLDVIDTGPGVKPELQEKIFEALFTTKARGIGLGLAVSRSLAEANDGRLLLSSRPGEGATFTLIVPAVAVLEPAR